jgi:phage-related baseplate assembly protein
VTIPVGTVGQTASGIQFVTTGAGIIANLASSSGDVPAVAVEGGAEGNVVAGAVLRFESKPPGVDTVGNAAPFVGGADVELDDAFRARIKQFIATLARSTVEALEFVAAGATVPSGQRVRFAHVFEDPINRGEVTLYVDDGSGTAELSELIVGENLCEGLAGPPTDSAVGGEEFLWTNFRPIKTSAGYTFTSSTRGALVEGTDYVLDDAAGRLKSLPALVTGEVVTGTYTAYDGLVREVQKLVDGDPDDRANYPGWRAAGVRVRVTVPTVLQQTVVASVLVAEGFVKATVLEEARAAVLDYINNLGISGDVLRAELIERIMGVAGVVNVSLTSPAADTILLDDQLPRALTANVLLS